MSIRARHHKEDIYSIADRIDRDLALVQDLARELNQLSARLTQAAESARATIDGGVRKEEPEC